MRKKYFLRRLNGLFLSGLIFFPVISPITTIKLLASETVEISGVPMINQNTDNSSCDNDPNNGCAITSIAMVLQYYGMSAATPNKVYQANGNSCLAAWGSLKYSTIMSNPPSINFTDMNGQGLDQIKTKIRAGYPVIIGNDNMFGYGMHWVVVVGFIDDQLIVNDPGGGVRRTISADKAQYIKLYTGTVPIKKTVGLFVDFNGDGKQDIIESTSVNHFNVGLSNGSNSFSYSDWLTQGGTPSTTEWKLGDFNGDGKTDLILRNNENKFYVGLSTGNGFNNTLWYQHGDTYSTSRWDVGDFDGDGKSDLIFATNNDLFYVGLSTGSGLNNNLWITQAGTYLNTDWRLGDFDGDGKMDLITRNYENRFYVGTSDGTKFTNYEWVNHGQYPISTSEWKIADVTGDGKVDLIFVNSTNDFSVSTPFGNNVVTNNWLNAPGNLVDSKWDLGDFNGDGKADIIQADPNNQFYVSTSNGNNAFNRTSWIQQGAYADWKLGDFNGDGKMDLATRNNENRIYVGTSTLISGVNYFINYEWVNHSSAPVSTSKWKVADYTGDGKVDILFVNNTNDFYVSTPNGNNVVTNPWYVASDGNLADYKLM